MTVEELMSKLRDMPLGAEVFCAADGTECGVYEVRLEDELILANPRNVNPYEPNKWEKTGKKIVVLE